MTEAQAALLETRLRPIFRCGYVPVRVAAVNEAIIIEKLLRDPFGIILPIGRNVDLTARLERSMNQITKALIYYASLVVAFLVPGVGEEQQDTV